MRHIVIDIFPNVIHNYDSMIIFGKLKRIFPFDFAYFNFAYR